MKASRLEKIYIAILVVIFAGIVVHAPISVSMGVLFPDYDLLIKSWKELLMAMAIPLALIIVSRHKLWKVLFYDWIFHCIIAYVLLHFLCMAVFYQGVAATMAGLAIDLRYILFFGLVYVAIRVLPQYRQLMLQVSVAGAFVVVVFATMQFFLPPDILAHIGYSKDTIAPYITIDQNPDYVRINSTLRGPNPLGAYAGMVLGLLSAAWMRGKLNFKDKKVVIATSVFGVCSLVALWLSYSRSALVAAAAIVGIVLAATVLRKLPRKAWIIGCAVVFALAGALIAARDTPFVSNVLLHENVDGGSEVSSNDEHVRSLEYGIDRMLHQPLGAGVGSTGSASLHTDTTVIIENQYLFVAHETGWVGLLLFMAIFCIILARLWRQRQDWLSLGVFSSGIGMALIGLLLPVWADDTVSIVWWALAALALAGGSYGRKQTE